MATAGGKSKTRQKIKTQTMRELMFASGGRCAMSDCGLPLTSPTGGWIGTVAHIIGAEKDGPRGAGPETPADRAAFANLILMCATHGREVDAPDTGEANFPIDKLRIMKQTHEAKVSEAVAAAIEQELSGLQTATGTIDTTLRTSTAATTAEGLLESLGSDVADAQPIVQGLAHARSQLRRLSQPALDMLSQLLELWTQQCRDDSDGSCDFGDSFGHSSPQMPCQHVDNRIMRGKQAVVDQAMDELRTRQIIDIFADEYEAVAYYTFASLWREKAWSYNFWPSVASFLYDGHSVAVQDWVRGLDFSVFDRRAADEREVPWR